MQPSLSLDVCVSVSTFFFLWRRYIDDVYVVVVLIWGLLFFGGAALPGSTGVSISCVPVAMRPFASSFSVVVCNILGYMLSPVFSGAIEDATGSFRIGFRACLFCSAWAYVFMLCGWLFARRRVLLADSGDAEALAAFKEMENEDVRPDSMAMTAQLQLPAAETGGSAPATGAAVGAAAAAAAGAGGSPSLVSSSAAAAAAAGLGKERTKSTDALVRVHAHAAGAGAMVPDRTVRNASIFHPSSLAPEYARLNAAAAARRPTLIL